MISIIIPVYNEAENIGKLVTWLKQQCPPGTAEIIVADGGSKDETVSIASGNGATVLTAPGKGRAVQMNCGASLATGEVLYFIHADTLPPPGFFNDIENALKEGYGCGRYRTRFDSKRAMLKLNAFFTRFDLFVCYGGDQTFFITRQLFTALKGFNEDMMLMEDYDMVTRAKKIGKYKIIQKDAVVSARKYIKNNWLTVQQANYTIVQMYKRGASQNEMAEKYASLLKS